MGRNENDEALIIPSKGGTGFARLSNSLGSLTAANGTNTVTITNVAPSGVGTATISQWLLINLDGTDYYIPMWT